MLKMVKLFKDSNVIVYFILKGAIKIYTEQGNPFIKYQDGDMFGDSDTFLDVKLFL